MFASKATAYHSEHLSGTPLLGRLLALSENIILGRKGLPKRNTLAITNIHKLLMKKVL
jgi:hypothetical protein